MASCGRRRGGRWPCEAGASFLRPQLRPAASDTKAAERTRVPGLAQTSAQSATRARPARRAHGELLADFCCLELFLASTAKRRAARLRAAGYDRASVPSQLCQRQHADLQGTGACPRRPARARSARVAALITVVPRAERRRGAQRRAAQPWRESADTASGGACALASKRCLARANTTAARASIGCRCLTARCVHQNAATCSVKPWRE